MYEKLRSRIRKSEASSTIKVKLRVRARSKAQTLIYCFLLKQYRGTSSLPNHRTSSLPNHRTSSLPNHHHPFRIIIIPSESCLSVFNTKWTRNYSQYQSRKWTLIASHIYSRYFYRELVLFLIVQININIYLYLISFVF